MSVTKYFGGIRSGSRRLDTISAALAFVVAVALFPLRFYASSIFIRTVPVVIGAASLVYLAAERYGRDRTTDELWHVSGGTTRFIRLGTIVGLAGMVFAAAYTGGRTVPFFAVAALVGTLIFAQIFFARSHALDPAVLLAQIVLYAFVVRWAALLTTPGLIGVDAWVHLPDYAASIRESGDLAAITHSKYYSAPLYHLLVVLAAEVFDTSLRVALYATLGVVMPLSILLIYVTTRLFIPVRWALFAAAAFAVADHVIRWGVHIIPTSMGLVFFTALFYGVSKLHTADHRMAIYALVMLYSIATVLTHQISAFVLLVFLGAGTLAQLALRLFSPNAAPQSAYRPDRHVNFAGMFVVTLPVVVASWSLGPYDDTPFLEGMIQTARERLSSTGFLELSSASGVDSETVAAMAIDVPTSVQLLNTLGFLVLVSVALVGGFALLRHERLKPLPLSWILAGGLMAVVTLGAPLFGLYFLIPERWYAFMYVPMIVLGAYGMRYLGTSLTRRQFAVLAAAFALAFTGPMLINDKATPDNPVHEDAYSQFAYDDAELDAAETIPALHDEEVRLRTDHPYYLLLRDWQHADVGSIELTDSGEVSADHVVYRRAQSAGETQVEHGDAVVRAPLERDSVCRPSMNVVYTNGDVWYCSAST